MQLARVLCQVWSPVVEGVPRYVFLDEPVSSLDIKHQFIVMHMARDFARRGGGVWRLTHDLNLTAMYADRVFLIHGGKLPREAPRRTARFCDDLIRRAFECRLKVGVLPKGDVPFVLPAIGGVLGRGYGRSSGSAPRGRKGCAAMPPAISSLPGEVRAISHTYYLWSVTQGGQT